jgi:hypothetical protein
MRHLSLVLGACLATVAFSGAAQAQFDPHLFRSAADKNPIPLADFDVRLDADGQAVASVRESLARTGASATRAYDLNRLAQRVPGVVVDTDILFGTPHFVRSTYAFLTPAVLGGSEMGEVVVRDFLDQYRGLFEVSPGELVSAHLARDLATEHNGMRHMTWKQTIAGIEISGCELRANLTARGELVNISSTLLPRPEGDFQPSPVRYGDREALTLAAASIGVKITTVPEPSAPQGAASHRAWTGSPDFRTDEPITTELTYFARSRTDIRSAWTVALPEIGIGNTYDVTIDATTGEVLHRENRLRFALGGTQPIALNVFTSDSPAPGSPGTAVPNGTQFPLVSQQLVTINPLDVAAWSPNGWINDGGNETLGNNVDAHTDLNNDNVADVPRPQGSPARTFNFLADTTLAPTTYRSAAVTQIFYLANRYHDKLFSLGFNEPAKNFQTTNFAGGVGGDAVQADGQDGSGTNNANFGTTGTDGSTGRMQMYIFSGPTPDRDGDLDADIVFHELSHGLSIRLLDGLVSGEQAGGMGEGWGDFMGLSMNSEAADDPNAVYCTGGWTVRELGAGFLDNYYFGIRRFPYSTDLNKNPQTLADIDPAQQNYLGTIPRSPLIGNTADEVHNVGEVWCMSLWECRAALFPGHGYGANDLMMQLVVDGLKLAPGTPSFIQARDAILQAELVDNGGANLPALWTAFAKRGMGATATAPAGTTTTGVHEAFDLPNLILFGYPNGKPAQLAPAVPTTFQVQVLGLGSSVPTPGTGQLNYSVNGAAFVSVPMTQTSANHYDATLPAFSCFDSVRYYVSTATNSGTSSDPSTAPAATNAALVATGTADIYADNFETDQGWVATNLGATSGNWQRGTPVNDPAWAYDPTGDGDGSGQCWLTQNATGNTDVDGGAVQLTSRAFDFSSPTAKIAYEYYLFLTVADGVDRLLVEINTNGGVGTWTQIAVHDVDGGTDWRHSEITASAVQALGVTLTNNTKVRFTANDGGTASIVEAGVDGFRVSQATCSLPAFTSFCFGDGTGTACPCGNNGAAGEGCASSLGAGATIVATGNASVATDTVLLTGNAMPNSSALFFQGTTEAGGGAGSLFGDGLRCASGSIIRLATKANAGGSSIYPDVGDLPVAQKGLLPVGGGVRTYQIWYRNAAAFCTASTFNLTNGVSVNWLP